MTLIVVDNTPTPPSKPTSSPSSSVHPDSSPSPPSSITTTTTSVHRPSRTKSWTSTAIASKKMLKLWPASPGGQLTPKVGLDGKERNPFDVAANGGTLSQTTGYSTTPTSPHPPYHHHLLSRQNGGQNGNGGGDLTPLGGAVPSSPTATSFTAALPTTSLSLHAPDFKMRSAPPKRARPGEPAPAPPSIPTTTPSTTTTTTATRSEAEVMAVPAPVAPAATTTTTATATANSMAAAATSAAGGASRGQIHVKVIAARNLNVQSTKAQPYVVVQFEQNEFISRDPIDETEKEIKGTATPALSAGAVAPAVAISRNGSSTALSALNAINSKSDPKKTKTPVGSTPSSVSSGRSVPPPTTNGHHVLDTSPSSSLAAAVPRLAALGLGSKAAVSRMSAHNPVWKHEVSFDVTSDQSAITFNVYDRAVEDHFFLGRVQIKPVLKHEHTVDQWHKLEASSDDVTVTGEMRLQITFEQYKNKRALTPRDFEFLKLIGRGTFGRVFQVRKRDTKRIYAMKILSKKEIVAKKEVAHTIGERKILQRSLECPFLVGLKFSFQTESDLYLVTDFKSGGELFWHLQKETRFTEDRARFYIAELVLALEHLHKYDIVYRDLKPENILLDATGHVALCDFGLSKANLRADELTNTFCGTTEYLAPEVLLDEHGYSKLVDFWSLGVLLFEMCCGWSPFYAEDTQQMYRNICFGKIRFPRGVINEDGKQFVKALLNRNPRHRLGAIRDAAELKEHPFFAPIDWQALAAKQITPPFKPVVESDESVANFDPAFTNADVKEMGFDEDALDESDPSEAWTAPSPGTHTPNGPLGSDMHLTPLTSPTGLSALTAATSAAAAALPSSGANGIEIKKSKKPGRDAGSSPPLTNSVQEEFKGFTFSGGESYVGGRERHMMSEAQPDVEQAVEDEEVQDPSTEDEAWDDESHAGRYAKAKRRGGLPDEDEL